jgi:hypothetical protein
VWRIRGALEEGRFAPLLARETQGERHRDVVLHRPTALFGVVDRGLVSDQDLLELPEGTWAVSPYIPGWDLDGLLEVFEEGLPEPALSEISASISRVVEGRRHGALSGAKVRVTPKAEVYVLGFRGGSGDEATLKELIEMWAGPGEGSLGDVVAAMMACNEPPLYAHPLSGQTLESRHKPAVPAKVRTAAFASVALVLGLASGWFLASGG